MPVRAGLAMDAAARAAIAASHLRDLRPDVLDRLLDGARRLDVAAGVTIHREGEPVRHVELVVHGLVRVHVTAPDGRTLTVRYCRVGALMGILSLYSTPFVMPATTHALVDSDLLAINPAAAKRMADRDVAVAKAMLVELSERASAFVAEISEQDLADAVGTVREVVVRSLRELRHEGMLQTGRGGVAITAPERLLDVADGHGWG